MFCRFWDWTHQLVCTKFYSARDKTQASSQKGDVAVQECKSFKVWGVLCTGNDFLLSRRKLVNASLETRGMASVTLLSPPFPTSLLRYIFVLVPPQLLCLLVFAHLCFHSAVGLWVFTQAGFVGCPTAVHLLPACTWYTRGCAATCWTLEQTLWWPHLLAGPCRSLHLKPNTKWGY